MLRLRFAMLTLLLLGAVVLSSLPALAGLPTVDYITVQRAYNPIENMTEYDYTISYVQNYGYDGLLWDFHAWLGTWTPGEIEITPPADWAGSFQGGTYGCETNTRPWTYGNNYYGEWKIKVKPGYGDGTTTYYFSDGSHNNVLQQPGVLIPLVPEPGSLLVLGSGLVAFAGVLLRKRK